ncbi:MAG: glycosyltransferase family 2 protein [Pseudomonadota bacterium]
MTSIQIIFWLACLLTIFPYAIYPLILRSRRLTIGSPTLEQIAEDELPTITIIVSARNEETVIVDKINNALSLDYPAEKLNLMVVSDASTDDTDKLVTEIADTSPRVKLLAIAERRGKTAGLNRAMEQIDSDLVVFTDANAMFKPDALRYLVAPFSNSKVGYVVGAQKYTQADGQSAGDNEGLYWRFELSLKAAESDFYSVVGGDGAIYAIRRELFTPLADEDINDFVNPLQIILKGYRGVFSSQAIAFEDPANSFDKEFNRKRRIVCRSWGALVRYGFNRQLFALPKFTFMVFSHKVLRWFCMVWISIAVLLNLILLISKPSLLYVLTAVAIYGSIALAMVGQRLSRNRDDVSSVYAIPYYFYMANIAAFLGVLDYTRGNRYVVWDHVRTTG